MFERFIQDGCEPKILSQQHRMRPQIAELVKMIYPSLTDGQNVLNFPSVTGMRKNVFFFDHRHPENRTGTEYSNEKEAELSVALAQYLIAQNIQPKSIIILAAYSAQAKLVAKIRNMRGGEPLMQVQVKMIDKFQVIIVSYFQLFETYSLFFIIIY